MTTRDRREAKIERLNAWAEKREERADAASARFHDLIEHGPPMGEPIKVGHHSEKAHRKHFDRLDAALGQAVEHRKMADQHASTAAGIASQLDRSIYSDDPDAIERLEERIASLEAQQERYKAENAAFRKEHRTELAKLGLYARGEAVPHPPYSISNLGADIRRNKARLAEIKKSAELTASGKPSRVTTARRDGTCDRCGEPIAVGAYIGKTGDEWSHVYANGDEWARCQAD